MTIYRILKSVSKPKDAGPGTMCMFEWLTDEQKQTLVDLKVISPVQGPPIGELAGWTRREKRLKTLGIETAVDYLMIDDEQVQAIRDLFRIKKSTVFMWRDDVIKQLTVPVRRTG